MAGKFKKGQTVYYASTNFGSNGAKVSDPTRVEFCAVVERVVDACGQKQVTFYNRGDNDSIFGKSMSFAWGAGQCLFATPDEAFAYLREYSAGWNSNANRTRRAVLANVRPDHTPAFEDHATL